MGDFLLELSKHRRAKQVLRLIHLPLSLPEVLRRAEEGWEDQPLRGDDIVVGAADPGTLTALLAPTLSRAGARCLEPSTDLSSRDKVSALVFDASGILDVAGLKALHDFFHPLVKRVRASGRVLVIGSPASAASTSEQAAAQQALDGFVRSLAKEVGKRGVTVNRVLVDRAGEERLEGVLRFFLSWGGTKNRTSGLRSESVPSHQRWNKATKSCRSNNQRRVREVHDERAKAWKRNSEDVSPTHQGPCGKERRGLVLRLRRGDREWIRESRLHATE